MNSLKPENSRVNWDGCVVSEVEHKPDPVGENRWGDVAGQIYRAALHCRVNWDVTWNRKITQSIF